MTTTHEVPGKGTFKLNDGGKIISFKPLNDNAQMELVAADFPAGVTSIGHRAFWGCRALTSIEIPAGVTSIGERAFDDCRALTSIVIPAGVKSIGACAFYDCRALTSIEIPAGITSIGDGAFDDCRALTSITSIGDGAFDDCRALTSINIPESVTEIGYGAFRCCSSLTRIVIPAGVKSIGESAFEDCDGLTSITLPTSLQSIGDGAFWGCRGLTSIEIPDSVTEIGENALKDTGLSEERKNDIYAQVKFNEQLKEAMQDKESSELPKALRQIIKNNDSSIDVKTKRVKKIAENRLDEITEIHSRNLDGLTKLKSDAQREGKSYTANYIYNIEVKLNNLLGKLCDSNTDQGKFFKTGKGELFETLPSELIRKVTETLDIKSLAIFLSNFIETQAQTPTASSDEAKKHVKLRP
jgi:hypothetical protein